MTIGRKHNLVDKDYFREMKTNKQIESHFNKKQKRPLSVNKFKNKADLIME